MASIAAQRLERPASAWREVLAGHEFLRLGLRLPGLLRQARGNGEPVLFLPGFMASDRSTRPMRRYLQRLGYAPYGWDLGRNLGDVRTLIPGILSLMESVAESHGEPVRLVGWSLGGVLAREAARERPDLAHSIVTMGTPVVGGPKYTRTAHYYENVLNYDLDALEREIAERTAQVLPVPLTVIYSKNDGIVAWQACIDDVNTHAEHIEVDACHLGLGFSPEVFEILAETLAAE